MYDVDDGDDRPIRGGRWFVGAYALGWAAAMVAAGHSYLALFAVGLVVGLAWGRVRTAVLGVAAMMVAGCAAETGNTVGASDALRTRAGICAKSTLNGSMTAVATSSAQRSIETCLRTGMPGTLADDGRTPFIATVVTGDANAPNADAGNWQVEVFYNGAPMGKRMMARAVVPQLTCGAASGGAPCDSWSTDLMRWAVPFGPGTYVFRYTYGLDTSVVTTNTITIGGQGATAAAEEPGEKRWTP